MRTFVTAVAMVLGIPAALLVLLALGDGKAGLVSGGLFYIALCLALYFLPTIVAMLRRQPAWVGILLLSLLLGWTLIGWVAALVWSVMPIKPERRLTLIEQALIERPPRRRAAHLNQRRRPAGAASRKHTSDCYSKGPRFKAPFSSPIARRARSRPARRSIAFR